MMKKISTFLVTLFLMFSLPSFAEMSKQKEMVNINTASVQELDESLEGVGLKIAQEIVKHRDTHGPFKSWDDLDKVKYVGSSLMEKNKKRIVFE